MNDNIDILKELAAPFKALENVMSGVAKNFAAATDTMKSAAREMSNLGKTIRSAFENLKHNASTNRDLNGSGGLFGIAALFSANSIRNISAKRNTALNNLRVASGNFNSLQDALSNGTLVNGNPVTPDMLSAANRKVVKAQKAVDDTLPAFLWLNDPIGQIKSQILSFKDNLAELKKGIGPGLFKVVTGFVALASITAVVVGAFAVMSSAAKSWVAHMKDSITGLVTSGGRLGQFDQLHNTASMFGMTGSQFGSRARQFGDLLTQGGIPAGIAAQMGIKPYGGLGGDQNYLDKFITALKNVLSDPDFDRSSKKARYLGLEEFMWLRDADQKYKDMALNAMGEKTTPADRRAAANAQAEMFKLQKELNEAWNEFGRKVLPIVISGLRGLTAALVFLVNNLTVLLGALVGGTIGFFAGGGPIGMGVGAVIGGAIAGGYQNSAQNNRGDGKEAISANTQAVKANTDAVIQNTMMQNGTYGGGSRFNRNVIPAGWGPMQINDSARGTAIALGALQL